MDWTGLDQIENGLESESAWIGWERCILDCIGLNWIELDWIENGLESERFGLIGIDVDWIGLKMDLTVNQLGVVGMCTLD